MANQRTQFLQRISQSLGRDEIAANPTPLEPPNAVQHTFLKGASTQEVKAVFIANAEAAGTMVYTCDPASLNSTILNCISQLAQGSVLLCDDPLLKDHNTMDALAEAIDPVYTWDMAQSREHNIEIAEAAAVGIAVARAALAETGTVMVYSHQGCGRSVTLLPTTTIFIVPTECIHPRLTQSMTQLQASSQTGLPSSINFISGASSTADIELVRVQGVHGPVKIAYIILG